MKDKRRVYRPKGQNKFRQIKYECGKCNTIFYYEPQINGVNKCPKCGRSNSIHFFNKSFVKDIIDRIQNS